MPADGTLAAFVAQRKISASLPASEAANKDCTRPQQKHLKISSTAALNLGARSITGYQRPQSFQKSLLLAAIDLLFRATLRYSPLNLRQIWTDQIAAFVQAVRIALWAIAV